MTITSTNQILRRIHTNKLHPCIFFIVVISIIIISIVIASVYSIPELVRYCFQPPEPSFEYESKTFFSRINEKFCIFKTISEAPTFVFPLQWKMDPSKGTNYLRQSKTNFIQFSALILFPSNHLHKLRYEVSIQDQPLSGSCGWKRWRNHFWH